MVTNRKILWAFPMDLKSYVVFMFPNQLKLVSGNTSRSFDVDIDQAVEQVKAGKIYSTNDLSVGTPDNDVYDIEMPRLVEFKPREGKSIKITYLDFKQVLHDPAPELR